MVKPRNRIDWTGMRKAVKPSSFVEEVLKSVKRYRRDKLIREQEECGRDEPPKTIPFPTGAKQAIDEPADTSGDA